MKKIALSFVAMLATFSITFAQSADEQKAWMDYATPGAMQQKLASLSGTFISDIKVWMKPDASPMESKGSYISTMIMGGRYQQSTYKSDFMGSPYEGMQLLGYDNKLQLFQSTWIDNMGTGVLRLEGEWDSAANAIEFTGKETDPSTGNMLSVREEFKIIDNDNQIMTMWMITNDKESKTMEITFKRQTK